MSGASWWATAEAERGPETLIQPNWGSVAFEAGAGWWCWVLAYALQRSRGRRRLNVPVVSIRFARLEREGITRSSHRRCGAFADERRIVAGDEAGRVRARNAYPVPRVIRLPPFDPG